MDETTNPGDWRLAISELRRESAVSMADLDKTITASIFELDQRLTSSIHELDQRLTSSIHDVDQRISGVDTVLSGVRATVRLQSTLLVALLGGIVTLLWKAFVSS